MDQIPTTVNQLSHITMDESEVFEALTNLNPSKAQSCDNISPYTLKFCTPSLASPNINLFTLHLSQHCLPQKWKIPQICPFQINLKLWKLMSTQQSYHLSIHNLTRANLGFWRTDPVYLNYCLPFPTSTVLSTRKKHVTLFM